MSKVRVHELAKEADVSNKALVEKLIEKGYDIKSHSSTVDAETADKIRATVLPSIPSAQKSKKGKDEKKEHNPVRRRSAVIRRRPRDKAFDRGKTTTSAPTKNNVEIAEGSSMSIETALSESQPTTTSVNTEEYTEKQGGNSSSQKINEEPQNNKKELTQETKTVPTEQQEDKELSNNAEKMEAVHGNNSQQEKSVAKVIETTKKESARHEKTDTAQKTQEKKQTTRNKEVSKRKNTSKKLTEKNHSRGNVAKVLRHIDLPLETEEPKENRNSRPKKKGKPAQQAQSAQPTRDPFPGHTAATPAEPQGESRNIRKKSKKNRSTRKDDGDFEERRSGSKRGGKNVKFTHFGPDYGERDGSGRRRKGKKAPRAVQQPTEMKASKRKFKVYDTISVGDLAQHMKVKGSDVIARLMGLGVMATINQQVDFDTASIIATEFGYEVEQGITEEIGLQLLEESEEGGEQQLRAPVVTVMGHVDHGKTSILDAIRKTDVAEGEAGGITQHIGAYHVKSAAGSVTFVDTPGHAAFTEMRSRGAQVTDIVVLVVAADDGVMDQTREAIAHSKAAEVPIIVAVNKIDKDNADPDRVKRELSELNLMPEDWGGDTMYVETSAKKHFGIDSLMETIMLLAEVQELKADKNRKARGRVIEAQLHKGRGPVATVLIQDGTLRQGDNFVAGQFSGKVRSMLDDRDRKVEEAGPAIPVEVQGLSGVPSAGDEFVVVTDEKMARNVSQERSLKARESDLADKNRVTFENLFDQMSQGEVKELKVVLRSDVQGTLEAFAKAAEDLSTDEIRVKILHEGTGTVTDSDILLASASDAIIIGFNVRPSVKVKELAEKEGIEVRSYDVIYHALDDIKKAMAGMLEPTFEEEVIGTAEVRDTFSVPKVGVIAGCFVQNGKMLRNAGVRVLREGVVIYTGKIESLKRFKDDAKEVQSGYECGIGVEKFNDIKIGDTLEAFVMNEVEATL